MLHARSIRLGKCQVDISRCKWVNNKYLHWYHVAMLDAQCHHIFPILDAGAAVDVIIVFFFHCIASQNDCLLCHLFSDSSFIDSTGKMTCSYECDDGGSSCPKMHFIDSHESKTWQSVEKKMWTRTRNVIFLGSDLIESACCKHAIDNNRASSRSAATSVVDQYFIADARTFSLHLHFTCIVPEALYPTFSRLKSTVLWSGWRGTQWWKWQQAPIDIEYGKLRHAASPLNNVDLLFFPFWPWVGLRSMLLMFMPFFFLPSKWQIFSKLCVSLKHSFLFLHIIRTEIRIYPG